MFRRVAACGIAAFALVSPAVSSGGTNVFADAVAPATSILIATTRDQAQDQIPDQIQDWTNGTQTQVQVSAFNPAEQSIRSKVAVRPEIQSPALTEPFGLITVPVASGEVLTKWSGVEADIQAENNILSRCRVSAELCPVAARRFLAIVEQGQARTGRARIGIINRAINLAIRPMSDLAQWGVIDRWSTPLATLTTGLGDCEDYAIAKYVALKAAGVAADEVKLVIVRDLAVGGEHAVAAVRIDDHWIILDNRRLILVDDSQMRQIVPLFVLDQSGVRKFAPTITADTRRASAPREGAASGLGSL
jgi:predicted transglutaminase-like cysteine proteinase